MSCLLGRPTKSNRVASTTLNKHDYLDHDLNRNLDSDIFLCVDTINVIISGISIFQFGLH